MQIHPANTSHSSLSAAAGDDDRIFTGRAHLPSGKPQLKDDPTMTDEDMEERERFILFVRVLLK
jgi:hypothetical protein